MIPTFHRIWVGGPMPPEFAAFGQTWLEQNPGWQLHDWGEDELAGWLENQALWDAAPDLFEARLVPRFRSDLARYEVLYRHGGVYLDTDFRAHAPLAPLLEGVTCFAVAERPGLVANGIMGAPARHPLLRALIKGLPHSVHSMRGQPAWRVSGPEYLTRTAQAVGGLQLLPTPLFYPYHHSQLRRGGEPPPIPAGCVAEHVWASGRGSVSVVVPWQTEDPHRQRAWEYVQARYAAEQPAWQVLTAAAPPGEWTKAAAVAAGVQQSYGDVLVVADADVWCAGTADAVDQVRRGAARVAFPHLNVRRLGQEATSKLYAGSQLDRRLGLEAGEHEYPGVEGGGLVVLERAVYTEVPMDPAFQGWGGEDVAWGYALRTLAPPVWRGREVLYHLWHPPAPERADRGLGKRENVRRSERYGAARRSPERMMELVRQAGGQPRMPPPQRRQPRPRPPERRWRHKGDGRTRRTVVGSYPDERYSTLAEWELVADDRDRGAA